MGSKWWQLWKAYVRYDEQEASPAAPPPAAAETGAGAPRSPSNSSSMDEDGVLVKAEEVGGAGAGAGDLDVVAAEASESVTVKAENNEHRVAELSLEEGGGFGGGTPAKVEPEASGRAGGPGPIDNGSLLEGRELREGMVSKP